MPKLKVLSVNTGRLGNAVYQQRTKLGFARYVADQVLESVNVTEHFREDLPGLAAYYLMTRRLPLRRDIDWDWYRLRDEYAQSLMTRRFIRRALARERADVLHIHTQSVALASTDILRSIPSVVSIDCTSALFARIHRAPARRTYRPTIRLEKACFEAARHIVCFSENARRSVLEDYGIPAAKTSVIRPTLDRERIAPPRTGARTPGPLRLLFVGNDFIRKGGADLVATFCAGMLPGCELDVVSNGVDALPTASGLRLHRGLTADSDILRGLYDRADVFVLPTHEDASPIVYLEAMAASLPCIGTTTLGVPELVQHEINGLTVVAGNRESLAEAIGRLRHDPALRARFGAAGREFVIRECDAATNCRRLANVFEAVSADRLDRSMLTYAA